MHFHHSCLTDSGEVALIGRDYEHIMINFDIS